MSNYTRKGRIGIVDIVMHVKWRLLITILVIEIITNHHHIRLYVAATFSGSIDPRIVGGVPDKLGSHPYYAMPANDNLCGATLIWKDILISAAHCTIKAWEDGILLGGNLLDGSQSLFYPVNSSLIHPEYGIDTHLNDIMIIKLYEIVTDDVTYAQLNRDPNIPKNNQQITAMGYGTTSERGPISQILLSVDLYKTDQEECQSAYHVDKIINKLMICNGYPGGGKDTCQGDSGGPILLKDTDIIAGIISFGNGCARPDVSGVNTRVSAYIDWIDSKICELSSDPPSSCFSQENASNITSRNVPKDIEVLPMATSSSTLSDEETKAHMTKLSSTLIDEETKTCTPLGSSCNVGKECCSSSCEGRLSNKVCI